MAGNSVLPLSAIVRAANAINCSLCETEGVTAIVKVDTRKASAPHVGRQ